MPSRDLSVCDYCGLPAPRSWWGGEAEGPAYCCYGCRFAAGVAEAGNGGDRAESRWLFTRLALAIFCTMNVMAFTMALWSSDVYGEDHSVLARGLRDVFRYLSMLFALPVYWSLGLPLLENAWHSLRRGIANIDVLLVAGVAASLGFSAYSVFRGDGAIYFEVGCAVLVLVTLGRWLEATGKARASRSLEQLVKLLPATVCVISDNHEEVKPLDQAAVGEFLRVRAGERIPCDGVLVGQPAHLDQQFLTGESAACAKEPGEAVYAGTLNIEGDLRLRVTRSPAESALSRLVGLVRQAQQARGRHEQCADQIARWFLPFVTVIALGTAIYHGIAEDAVAGMLAGLSVVLIACPCALGIATPLAMWAAIGEAARRRVLFHSGEMLERLATVEHVCFDKSGTLTTGTPIVERFMPAPGEDPQGCFCRANSLASGSHHIYARAIADFARQRSVEAADVSVIVETKPGRGLAMSETCRPRGDLTRVMLGSERWMNELGVAFPGDLRQALDTAHGRGQASVCLAWSDLLRGVFILTEEWRPEADPTIRALQAAGLKVTILTGDHATGAAKWGKAHFVETRSGLLPEEKLNYLHDLKRQGTIVAMVGDGINDGPALAGSDVGIALGCGTDVSRDAAGVCLLDNDLRNIPWAIQLARRTVRIVRQNLFWAFAYNIVGIGLACAGKLNPVLAALAMTLSSLFVLANSLRLRTTDDDTVCAAHESGSLSDPRPSGSGQT
jgi:heavy metal translocating P-type ATPase